MAKFLNALNSKLNNKAADLIGGISNPIAREGVQNLLDTALPGFGGGTPDYRNKNAYSALVENYITSNAEQGILSSQSNITSDEHLQKKHDWRARLRPKNGGAEQFYNAIEGGDYLMRPIQESGGLVWQYTPSLFLNGGAVYDQQEAQGSNYSINTYVQSKMPIIPLTADFTANTDYEARYMLGLITFIKVATKSYYGDAAVADGKYGTPPPVLIFEYLGEHGFNKVPVVISNYSIQYPDDVDYVPVRTNIADGDKNITYVPTRSTVTIDLLPTYTPHKLRKRFDLDDISSGRNYKDGFI